MRMNALNKLAYIQVRAKYNSNPRKFQHQIKAPKLEFDVEMVAWSLNLYKSNDLYFAKICLARNNIEIQCVLTFCKIL